MVCNVLWIAARFSKVSWLAKGTPLQKLHVFMKEQSFVASPLALLPTDLSWRTLKIGLLSLKSEGIFFILISGNPDVE